MRQLVLMCALAILGAGCVEVVSHRDEFDAGPEVKVGDATGEPDAPSGLCQSGVRWGGGSMASAVMSPGRPCMGSGCHTPTSKTPMTVAGTVYPLKGDHDENDCNGADPSMAGVAIQVTDEAGNDLFPRLQINGAGNFYTNKAVPSSFKVIVISQGRSAPMLASVMDGNCNYCHTPDGFMSAKGRMVPAPP